MYTHKSSERGEKMKTINFQIDDNLHRQMRLEVVRQDKSIKPYITELIQKDLETKKEQSR